MPCSLVSSGSNWTAAINAVVTVKVTSNSGTVNVVGANYNNNAIPAPNNTVQFTVVNGPALLMITLAGPPDTIEVVEDCGGGQTQHLFGYTNAYHPLLGFTIIGQ